MRKGKATLRGRDGLQIDVLTLRFRHNFLGYNQDILVAWLNSGLIQCVNEDPRQIIVGLNQRDARNRRQFDHVTGHLDGPFKGTNWEQPLLAPV